MNQNITLDQFAATHKVTLATVRRLNKGRAGWAVGSSHYTCVLKCGGRKMSVTYSMGPAHRVGPTLNDLLNCLASDASSYENADSEDAFCAEFGDETHEHDRANRRAYRAIAKQVPKLKALLGEEAYKTLLWDCERL